MSVLLYNLTKSGCVTFNLILMHPVVQRLDNAIHWINRSQVDSVVCFVNTDPLDCDLSIGQRYPAPTGA